MTERTPVAEQLLIREQGGDGDTAARGQRAPRASGARSDVPVGAGAVGWPAAGTSGFARRARRAGSLPHISVPPPRRIHIFPVACVI
jgi:hypothetical protein